MILTQGLNKQITVKTLFHIGQNIYFLIQFVFIDIYKTNDVSNTNSTFENIYFLAFEFAKIFHTTHCPNPIFSEKFFECEEHTISVKSK